jgi:hypothetical protein
VAVKAIPLNAQKICRSGGLRAKPALAVFAVLAGLARDHLERGWEDVTHRFIRETGLFADPDSSSSAPSTLRADQGA